jgi:hypothetical protein
MAISYLPDLLNKIGKFGSGGNPTEARRSQKGFMEQLSYPMDSGVDDNNELDNYVMFYVYVDESTSADAPTEAGTPTALLGGNTVNGKNAFGGSMGELSEKIQNLFGQSLPSNQIDGFFGSAKATALGTADSLVQSFGFNKQFRKLQSGICLHLPQAFTSSSTANWRQGELGQLGGSIAGGSLSDITSKFKAEGLSGVANTYAGDAARIAADTVASATDAFGANFGNILQVKSRKVANPYMEQLFENMSFREFQFTYEFAARSEEESRNIDEIIRTFKYHMHPELTESGLYFIYPSMFDIKIYHKDAENQFLDRISTCVLTNLTTNYTSSGVFSTLRNGQPTEISLTMTFREIEPLTKERVKEGF